MTTDYNTAAQQLRDLVIAVSKLPASTPVSVLESVADAITYRKAVLQSLMRGGK